MIIRKKKNWFGMLFVLRGSVLPQLLPRLSVLFTFTAVVVYFKSDLDRVHGELSTNIYTVFGIALAIFLGFRNTVSYDRFWEGRKLWGALLNDTRSLAQQVHNFIPNDELHKPEKVIFIRQMAAMVYALNHQLRHTDAMPELQKLLEPELASKLEHAAYKPVLIMRELGARINSWRLRGSIDTILQAAMDKNLANFSDIIGGCERIAGTPIPFSYDVLLHRTIYIYCFLLPLGFANALGWFAPFIITFVAYTFTALEAIADELEDPFGNMPNDLALDAMSANIERSIAEIEDLPVANVEPVNSFYIT
ncbi:putative membrane protein [Mucilaginibacter oryzae]|uniref:Putative membrane protein n=1 Tax=Mucilaginibacter oryzae TaxID=468058 RepID=A0A316HI10_9SPHI|nr:bestrophin family ion channel [Mucilaginibacter oryzae]PWK80156.1 putative membrane protein [Mucilaginibacter oryzae]